MEKIQVMTNEIDRVIFKMDVERETFLEIRIAITNRDGVWNWDFHAGNYKWNDVYIYNEKFNVDKRGEKMSKETVQKINEGFYELFRRLKNDPAYRLKLMNMLNDETREIWINV